MCTDKTLNEKIKKYNAIAAEIKALEAEKKKLSEAIIAEYDSRRIERFGGLQIINQTRETIKKADVPDAIWDRFKSISTSRFLRACKA